MLPDLCQQNKPVICRISKLFYISGDFNTQQNLVEEIFKNEKF
jgi:hypothetical protein